MKDLPRFLTLDDVQEVLSVSRSQAYALVRSGELRAIRVGGRGVWRVGVDALEQYIADAYERTARDLALTMPTDGTD